MFRFHLVGLSYEMATSFGVLLKFSLSLNCDLKAPEIFKSFARLGHIYEGDVVKVKCDSV